MGRASLPYTNFKFTACLSQPSYGGDCLTHECSAMEFEKLGGRQLDTKLCLAVRPQAVSMRSLSNTGIRISVPDIGVEELPF